MSDNLTVFGVDYTNVAGIKAHATSDSSLMAYIRPQGSKSITQNGTVDVTQYAQAVVNVAGGVDMPVFTVVMAPDHSAAQSVTCSMTFDECSDYINDDNDAALVEMSAQGDSNTFTVSASLFASNVTKLTFVMVSGGIPFADVSIMSDETCSVVMQPSSVTTLTATANGTYTDEQSRLYSEVTVNVPSGAPTLQSKTATPTEQQQTVTPDSGYDGLSDVTVGAISSTYVGSGITRRSSTDLTASGATVSVPAGYYESAASKSVASGTTGTPTATKGSVSNHSISVTPSVTNTAGYIAGGTLNGTAVSVSASELVSGTLSITSSGTKDVTNYASASVAAGGATASATKGTVSNHSVTVTPSVTRTAGYVTAGTASGTAVTVSASELVSGNLAITDNTASTDVTNYATVSVNIPFVTYYTSSSTPTSSQGSDGDIWLVTA